MSSKSKSCFRTCIEILLSLLVMTVVIVIIVAAVLIAKEKQNDRLMKEVYSVAQSEFNKIQLPNELVEEQKITSSGCHYDFKVGQTRCRSRFTKYFGANKDPMKEYSDVDSYLKTLDWKPQYPRNEDFATDERMYKSGYWPSKLYSMDISYKPEIHLRFLSKEGADYKSEDELELLQKYSDTYKYIYYISLKTDFID